MAADLSTTFTGIHFPNPFLLSSAPPTESESNILRAFEAGWGGVVAKTIGLHPVVNVFGARTRFMRTAPDTNEVSMKINGDRRRRRRWPNRPDCPSTCRRIPRSDHPRSRARV